MFDQPTLLGGQLDDFLNNIPFGGTVKDSSGKYVLVNFAGAKLMGLKSSQDIKGLTANDLFKRDGILDWKFNAQFSNWNAQQLERIQLLDQKTQFTARCTVSSDILYTPEGFILFEKLIKIPLMSFDNKKTIGILTINQDLTFQNSLFSLFGLYQKHYPNKEATQKFFKYLKLDCYFNQVDLPTNKEIQILLLMRQYPSYKYVARILDITVATASNHISALQSKLNASTQLIDVLAYLRTLHSAPEA